MPAEGHVYFDPPRNPFPPNDWSIMNDPTRNAVLTLIKTLGYRETDVRGIDIRSEGILRIYGTNHSLRSVRFAPLDHASE